MDEEPKVGPDVAFLIGDHDDTIRRFLLELDKSDSIVTDYTKKNALLLDTKYYTAVVQLLSFDTVNEASSFDHKNIDAEVGAIICRYNGEPALASCRPWLQRLSDEIPLWQADVQVMVCDRLGDDPFSRHLRRYCIEEEFELVELDPSQETLQELAQFCEFHGLSRIRQILESANWTGRVMKDDPMKSMEHRLKIAAMAADRKPGLISKEDKRLIELGFGPRRSMSDVYEDVPDVEEDVMAYLKEEMENLKLPVRAHSARNKKKKKKSKGRKAEDEFGEFKSCNSDCAVANGTVEIPSFPEPSSSSDYIATSPDSSAQASASNVSSASSTGIPKSVRTEADAAVADSENSTTAGSRELSFLAKSMIDGLFGKNPNGENVSKDVALKFEQVRATLAMMTFGPDRQNLAADTMIQMIKTLGAEDLFAESSEEET